MQEWKDPDDNVKDVKAKLGCTLPEEDEIVILLDGTLVVDEEGPIRVEELGTAVDTVLCGC